MDPDFPLLLRLKNGDTGAFDELVDKYERPIIKFAARTLADVYAAEDVSQIVFFQAYRSLANFQFAARLSTWLYAIARNLCLNELRRRSRYQVTSLNHENGLHLRDCIEDTRSPTAPELLCRAELQEKIGHALATLPEPQRTALLLCRERQLSYGEIAQALGVSVTTTKSIIHRGRRTLKRKLSPYLSTKS
jgi:RNA polymerase sigma-70 factor (ECF subfamily)